MDRKKIQRLKYEMGLANAFANFVGAVFVQSAAGRLTPPIPEALWHNPLIEVLDVGFTPLAFVVIIAVTIAYERPIHRYLSALAEARPIPPELAARARRRLLNEPFMTIAADLGIWVLATFVWTAAWLATDAPAHAYQQTIFNCVSIGLITVTLAFFLQEHILQKRMAPLFFPAGGLSAVPGTLRIRIRTRLTVLLLAINIIPLASLIVLFLRIADAASDPQQALAMLKTSVSAYGLIFLTAGIFLTGLISRNMTIPFLEIISALRGVRNGRFDQRVQVTTNDEIGYTGDVINEMAAGLVERERMRRALDLAMEVQQNLLPRAAPQLPGLDVAGASLYCEETGGDYFDYLEAGDGDGGRAFAVAVGDVSDHGVPSAILMTTARAFLRERVRGGDSLAHIVGDVNAQLCRDVEDTGRFVTLFFAALDRPGLRLAWVNAGHEPAVVYDPAADVFTELGRTGLPLGVVPDGAYEERRIGLAPGQVLAIGTDGIWESTNGRGEMFGKIRFQEVIRANCRLAAAGILAAAIEAVDRFCRPVPRADDITLVVIKIEATVDLSNGIN